VRSHKATRIAVALAPAADASLAWALHHGWLALLISRRLGIPGGRA
jgi:hypothetical protein